MSLSNSPVVSFALHSSATKNGYKKILIRVYFKGFYKKRSTGLDVKVSDWNPVRQRVRRSAPYAISANTKLKQFYESISSDIESCNGKYRGLKPMYQAVDYARRVGYVDDALANKILENRLKSGS